MQQSLTSVNAPENYPQNVASRTLAPYILDTIQRQLKNQAPRLFTDEADAALDFLDLGNGAQGILNIQCHHFSSCSALQFSLDFWPSRIKKVERLRTHLGIPQSRGSSSHLSRFL